MKRHQAMRQLADRHGHRALAAFGPGRPPQHRHAVAVAGGTRQAQTDGHGGPKATKGRRIAAGIWQRLHAPKTMGDLEKIRNILRMVLKNGDLPW